MTLRTSLVLAGDDAGATAVLERANQALERVEQSTASLARAQAAARRETDAAKASYKSGEISLEQYNRTIIESKTALGVFEDRHRKAAAEVRNLGTIAGVSTNQAKAGYINLGRQMQDVAQQAAQPGVSLGTIIMQQGGQVADAVAMMGGRFSGFAAFLSGPWGAAITVGIGLLVNLAISMRESGDAAESNADALKKVQLASSGLSDAQSVLGEMFDLTTGKIKSQNESLRLNAQITGIKLRAEALAAKDNYNKTFATGIIGRAAEFDFSQGLVQSGPQMTDNKLRAQQLRNQFMAIERGQADPVLTAKWAEKFNFTGLRITRAEFLDALTDKLTATDKLATADKIENSLKNNSLDAGLRKTSDRKARTPRAASSGLFGREINMAEATSIATRAGFQVNSGTRTYAEQKALYDRWVAQGRPKDNPVAMPGTSAHERANALDIQFGKGVSPQSLRKAFDAEGVRLTKIIKEKGHYHIEWSSKGADKLQREAQAIDNFGDRAKESIARINAQFDAQPRLVDQAAAATRELGKTIGELRDKKPVNWEGMVADAQAAKGTIQEALVRPFQQLRQESERRLQIDQLITAGREDEANALQIIWQKESELGPLDARRKQDILEMVQHERAVTEELGRRREVIGYYLDASRSIRDSFTQFFSTGSFGFKGLWQSFQKLNGQAITEQLFGGAFRDLDNWLKGQSGLSPSVDFMAQQTERAGGAVGALADTVNAASQKMAALASGGGGGALEASFDATFGKSIARGAVSSASSMIGRWTSIMLGGETPKTGQMLPVGDLKGSVMTLTPATFFSELIRRASTGLKLNLGDETVQSLGKHFQGGMWGQFGSQMVLGKSGGVGSFIGGAFGESLFKAAAPKLFKSLGSFAGPIGSIAGGILGGLIGGLFSKAKTGGVAVGAVNGAGAITGTGGNNANLKSQLSGSGNSINSALAQIASQLGGSIGNYSVAIGMRKDEFRVSASGNVGNTTAKKTGSDIIYKGKDEAAAIQAAIANAIQDGAVKGLSAAVQKALQSSSNIDQAIQEAMKVQDVETAIGGIGAALRKQFTDFEKQAAERLRIAQQYGFDVVAMEKRNAEDRLKLSQKLLAEQVGSLQQLIDDMTSGSLFEGSAVDQRQALLDKIAAAKAEADAGTEGAADKLSNLLQQLNSVSKEAFATTGNFAADRSTILDAARDTIAKANQRIADAQAGSDPALATTNAALDENNSQNAQIIAALGITNTQLAALIASGGGASGSLAALARTSPV